MFGDILPVWFARLKYWLCIEIIIQSNADQDNERISKDCLEAKCDKQVRKLDRRYNTELPRNLIEITF